VLRKEGADGALNFLTEETGVRFIPGRRVARTVRSAGLAVMLIQPQIGNQPKIPQVNF
jgi:hypothetical protein